MDESGELWGGSTIKTCMAVMNTKSAARETARALLEGEVAPGGRRCSGDAGRRRGRSAVTFHTKLWGPLVNSACMIRQCCERRPSQ
jgi:hypothetical protein